MSTVILWVVLAWLVCSIPVALVAGKIMARASEDYDRAAYGEPKKPVYLP